MKNRSLLRPMFERIWTLGPCFFGSVVSVNNEKVAQTKERQCAAFYL